jgi:diadenosine tetraphosphate (Ap4A) HIT family hydrolase
MLVKESFQRADPAGPCFVCRGLDPRRDVVWYDKPVRQVDGVATALLGVGAIEPGYLLVFPSIHVTSLAQVPSAHRAALADFVDEVRGAVERRFGPTVLFEHAGCQTDDPTSSACVAHAHLHLWAVGHRVRLSLPRGGRSFPSLGAFLDAGDRFVAEPYVLAQNWDDDVLVGRSIGVPQYFRRQVAAQLGRRDEWDYAAFPYETEMSRTLSLMARGA